MCACQWYRSRSLTSMLVPYLPATRANTTAKLHEPASPTTQQMQLVCGQQLMRHGITRNPNGSPGGTRQSHRHARQQSRSTSTTDYAVAVGCDEASNPRPRGSVVYYVHYTMLKYDRLPTPSELRDQLPYAQAQAYARICICHIPPRNGTIAAMYPHVPHIPHVLAV